VKVVRHGQTLNRDHDVFIASYLEGLGEEARLTGYNVEATTLEATIGGTVDPAVALMRRTDAVGFVVLGTELSADDVVQLGQVERPLVFMDTCFDSETAFFVNMDNAGAVFQAVSHLHAAGHRQIGYIRTAAAVQNFRLRDLGFAQAMQRLGLPVADSQIFTVDSTFDGAYQSMRGHLRARRKLPTAFFVVNDITAYGCLKAFKEKGLRVPQDVSIVGFDDLPMSEMLDPPLSSIRVMNRGVGRAAMRLLARRIVEGPDMPIEKIQIGGQLIARQSVRKPS
jgi:DNA-binding LacI/PurR family transcriptional regulator